jgi:hypothetical protein
MNRWKCAGREEARFTLRSNCVPTECLVFFVFVHAWDTLTAVFCDATS